MTLAFPVSPMKATMASALSIPIDDDPDDTPWAYEIKWDGHRTIAHIDDETARLQSSAGHDVSGRWPEHLAIAGAVNASAAILDGEMLVIGDDGRPSFDLVQRRDAREHPALFSVFDVLSIDGVDTIGLPYADRRRLLADLVEAGDHWNVPAHHVGGGADLVAATVEQGLEGVIAKRLDSTYRPGTRSKDWLKIKNRTTVTLTIGGFTAGSGARASTFGALLVGMPVAGSTDGPARLRFAGGVGTGFTHTLLDDLVTRLRALVTATCPFEKPPPAPIRRKATWVRPELRAEVEIAEFTNDGSVRHASFVRLVDGP